MTSRENEVQIQSYRGRAYNVTVAQKIGLGKDFLKIPVNGLPADARKPATFNSFPKIWNWRKMEVEPLESMKWFG